MKTNNECRKIQAKLNSYLDNELKPETREMVKLHLQNCNDCQQEYALMKELNASLREYPEAEMPEYMVAKLLQIPKMKREKGLFEILKKRFVPVPIAAAILLSLASALFVGQNLIDLQEDREIPVEYQLAQETFYYVWEDITNE